ncbi:DUF6353 family protein [Pseudobutyrivibrio sp.]
MGFLSKLPFRLPKLPVKLTQAIGKLTYNLGRNKPGVFTIIGVAAGVGTAIWVGVTTYKNRDTIKTDISNVRELKAEYRDAEENALESCEEIEVKLVKARRTMMKDLLKIYWKPGALGSAAVFFVLHGHNLMKRQLGEVTALLAVTTETLQRYREAVVKEYGAEKDQEFMYGAKTVEAIDAETGEVTQKIVPDPGRGYMPSIYARWLDEGDYDSATGQWKWKNNVWNSNKGRFISNLKLAQNECNDMLRSNGWLTLNDVYKKLGLPRTKEGQLVGWVRGGGVHGEHSDGYVDFRVFPEFMGGKYQLPVNRAFLDPNSGQSRPLLDFNVEPIDYLWDDIYEYDNRSNISYDKRRFLGDPYESSAEYLDRWFQQNEVQAL